ncbi:MAG: hypothetical protein ACOX02_02730 [Acholeplasmatales bacterium]
MKKLRFLLVLFGLFALIGFGKTVKAADNVTVTIRFFNDGIEDESKKIITTEVFGSNYTPVGITFGSNVFMF